MRRPEDLTAATRQGQAQPFQPPAVGGRVPTPAGYTCTSSGTTAAYDPGGNNSRNPAARPSCSAAHRTARSPVVKITLPRVWTLSKNSGEHGLANCDATHQSTADMRSQSAPPE